MELCSKQKRTCFLVFSSLINIVRRECSTAKTSVFKASGRYVIRIMFYHKKRVFKARGLLYSLFMIDQYCARDVLLQKNVCSKQAGGCFLIYSSLIKMPNLLV